MVVVDRALHARYLNPAAEALFALSARAATGEPAVGWIPELVLARVARTIDEGEPWMARELPLVTGGLRRAIVDVAVSPSGDRAVLEFSGLDRYLRISREDALATQQETAQSLVRGLAHEIKNPLGGIRGAAQLLERRLDDPSLREYTRVVIGEADRLGALVDALLGPDRAPTRTETNVHEVTEQVAALVASEYGRIEIKREYDPSLPPIAADRDQLAQALLNLVRNAAQALAGAGVVSLRTRLERSVTIRGVRHRHVVCVDVVDAGPGIPAARQASIFLPLVTTRGEGNGLGLPIAQTIAARHGGLIECTSEPGETVFTMLLPVELTDD